MSDTTKNKSFGGMAFFDEEMRFFGDDIASEEGEQKNMLRVWRSRGFIDSADNQQFTKIEKRPKSGKARVKPFAAAITNYSQSKCYN